MPPNTNKNVFTLLFSIIFMLECIDFVSCLRKETNVTAGDLPLLLRQGTIFKVQNTKPRDVLTIFCWKGSEKSPFALWRTASVHLNIEDDDSFLIYKGDNTSHVEQLHKIQQESWFSFLPWKEKQISISPFDQTCVGVYTKYNFGVLLDIRYLNFKELVIFTIGVALFLMATTLCENTTFHYTTGTFVGVAGSILIVIYMLSRLIPKKSGAYAVLIGGSSIAFYILRNLWENLHTILKEHSYYVIGYIATSALISFVVSYRFGPVTNARTIRLLQWGLQILGLYLIFISSEHREGVMAIILIILTVYNFPSSWTSRVRTMWRQKFPPKVRLLTEEEYLDQANKETRKALNELRQFCHSPQCNSWKTMTRLKDPLRLEHKPQPRYIQFVSSRIKQHARFAEFVEGASHLSDREVLDYENETFIPQGTETWTDDDSDDEQ